MNVPRIELVCPNCTLPFMASTTHVRVFCSFKCRQEHACKPDVIEARFWSKVRVLSDDMCWIWIGPRTSTGYGQFDFILESGQRRYKVKAHRFSYVVSYKKSAHGLEVCHDCPTGDNPLCVNPAHLWLGTQLDNITDMVSKNRHIKGATSGHAKLTELQVLEIYDLHGAGWMQKDIAARFGVHSVTISDIVCGRTWKYLLRQ